MKQGYRFPFSLIMGFLLLSLAPDYNAAQQSPGGRGLTKIRTAYVSPASGTVLPHIVAKDKGWFAEERLDSTVIYTYKGLVGLLGGSLDIVSEGADDALFARKQGEDVIAVDVIESKARSGYFVTRPEIESLEQLRGKTVGVPDIPSGLYFLTIKFLMNHGLAKDDVTWRKVGNGPARVGALENGLIDGTFINLLGWIQAQELGSFNLLATPRDLDPFPYQMLVVKTSWAQANEEALVGYILAIERGKRWLLDPANEDQALQIYLRHLPSGVKMDEKTARGLIKEQRDQELYDLSLLTHSELEPVVEMMELGGGKGPLDVKGFVDMRYYERAMGK
jgi:ABC-type nitrate/sulfonate/bicarbonate transport system substrate-binding protein